MRTTPDNALPHVVLLKDGSSVLIRRSEPEDFDALFRMFNSLSGDAMFRRFLRSQKRLTKGDAEEMLRVDDRSVTSLIAILLRDHEGQAMGEARYVTDSTGRPGEAAMVVADEWQNRGLGTALALDLIAVAKRQGLSKLFAYFDLENESIIRVGEKVGFKLARKEGKTDYSLMKAEIGL